jgi:Cdc6-like AAA superfamily ATPase
MPSATTRPLTTDTPHEAAFATPVGPDVFSGIVYGVQIWTPDPYDVEAVHADAREAYHRLLTRASAPERPGYSKTLLLLGESGSGKTHLMRAFRTTAHESGSGYCGYLQIRTRSDNYARYVLSNVVTSLEQPFKAGHSETGLHRLASGLLDALDAIPDDDRQRLCDDLLEPDELARLVHRFADIAVQYPRFQRIDINVIRAVLYTLPNDGRIRPRILNWLRCEDLGRYDRELIGDLVPRPQPEKPMETIVDLGRLMYAVHNASFVLLVDQIDHTLNLDRKDEDQGEQFRAAVATLLEVADKLPTAVIVVGCLEDLFKTETGRECLPKWALDRLERDPDPIRLSGKPTDEQIAAIIGRRLEVLFDAAAVEPDPTNPLAPFTSSDVARLSGLQTRSVLESCLRHRAKCLTAGHWLPFEPDSTGKNKDTIHVWEQLWNDFLALYKSPPLDESGLAELLGCTIRTASAETPGGTFFGADPDGRFVPVEVHHPGNSVDLMYVVVCDRPPQGGALGRQVEEAAKIAGEFPAVLVRSTEYPKGLKAAVSQEIAKLVAPRGKGRRVVVANSDWRAMAAFRDFHGKHHAEAGFADWQRAERPLAELPAVNAILALDKLLAAAPVVPPSPPPPPPKAGIPKETVAPKPVASRTPAGGPVRLGTTRSTVPAVVDLQLRDLCRHAAFLGGSGSGKTTAALTLIEQLLLAGVPAVLLDRKGDLAQYADPAAWTVAEPDPDRAARRDRLRAALDVRLYTPGSAAGRPLAIPIVPPDLGQLPAADQEQMAQFAAAALGSMLAYKGKSPDPKLVILQKGIEVLGRAAGAPVTVKAVQKLVADRDEALTAAVDGFEDKHYKRLAEDLLSLVHQRRSLLEGGEPLDMDVLLGRDSAATPDKARLTVISTQFLGDAAATDFWVSQFLLAVDRWRAKNPSPDGALQAVFLFDEADQYLPAVGKPATKGPMEGLLKRARSAGVGVFLATQSPGDFDYKCRDNVLTWLVGKVKEPVAINKLKPVLTAGRADVTGKLAGQAAGQFYLARETDVTPVGVDRNLIPTTQLPEDRVLAAAKAGLSGSV